MPASPRGAHGWFVSTPHKVQAEVGRSGEEPYGLRHARRTGDTFTACGESAVTWTVFDRLPFRADVELACRHCARSLVQREYGALI